MNDRHAHTQSIMRQQGLSVVVCCFNSEARIRATLLHLAAQQLHVDVEVILVDNNCTDNTVQVAIDTWREATPIGALRIVREPKPGLVHARHRGLSEAAFEFVVCCDDDNWLASDYLQTAFDAFQRYPDVAALGGHGTPVFERNKPDWFDHFEEAYATGSQARTSIDGRVVSLFGAGLCLRQSALHALNDLSFRPLFTGRVGASLASAEDTELTMALVVAGFRIFYLPALQFRHFMTERRMNRVYLRRLFVSFGAESAVINLYRSYLSHRPQDKAIRNWFLHFGVSILRAIKYMVFPPKPSSRLLYIRWSAAYIRSLFAIRRINHRICCDIARLAANAPVHATSRNRHLLLPAAPSAI